MAFRKRCLPTVASLTNRLAIFLALALAGHREQASAEDRSLAIVVRPSMELQPASLPEPPAAATERDYPQQADENGEASSENGTIKPAKRQECIDNDYCLNGATCVVSSDGTISCICPEDFYGIRCQTREICATAIAGSLTGDEICARIGTTCLKRDKYFRCKCQRDEYFVFKSTAGRPSVGLGQPEERPASDTASRADSAHPQSEPEPAYLAQCRKVDRCLGKRCRQMSEVCREGECVCNQNLGYMRDQQDGLCKLLNPCLASAGSAPICGQAQCVATYDQELYRCVCPPGYQALKVSEHRNSTQCALLFDTICAVPLLNKCQHICQVDSATSSYKCSCLPGYRPGAQAGVDDHMCFFDEHLDSSGDDADTGSGTRSSLSSRTSSFGAILQQSGSHSADDQSGERPANRVGRAHAGSQAREVELSAQERCNMYCEDNKICVLERDTTNSYRCECDRQGYVSVGDRCLDWCAAAEFSHQVRRNLEAVCYTGVCKASNSRPAFQSPVAVEGASEESARLERESSWRPTFECDCSSSQLLTQDPKTRLCKLDFREIMRPCLPGNDGYVDCVENKNAYCAVLHKPTAAFIRDLQRDSTEQPESSSRLETEPTLKPAASDKLYTCVCSPEKKLLVDKPRNKARCVNECELLNIECGRFNRKCRAASIDPENFVRKNLVLMDTDGYRMSFDRNDCDCLPGFSVRASESADFGRQESTQQEGGVLPVELAALGTNPGPEVGVSVAERSRAKYKNTNPRCLLDYDVVEFHATFGAPADFDPNWVKVRHLQPASPDRPPSPGGRPTANGAGSGQVPPTIGNSSANKSASASGADYILPVPQFMHSDIADLHKEVVLVSQCDPSIAALSIEAYQECTKYRYWILQKLRNHFVDWRRVMSDHLSRTFELMEGNIRLEVNKCEAIVKRVSSLNLTAPIATEAELYGGSGSRSKLSGSDSQRLWDPTDQYAIVESDLDCELTLHTASGDLSTKNLRKVLLEKQLKKFIFERPAHLGPENDYYLMAPNMLIKRDAVDQLAKHRKFFNPCESDYHYCDRQTICEMADTVNFTCTCDYGYTPIGSRDIYYADSRKEVCEDINECLFDVCKELEPNATCINEIGDYKCQCNRHFTGDNKRFCTYVCNTIPCKHGKCRLVDDHHAFCECEDGYKEADCSVLDPNVALRKANMIICGSIFTSVLLLAITSAISLNSQLRKTKKKLKKLEAAKTVAGLFEFSHQQQPFRSRLSKVSVCS